MKRVAAVLAILLGTVGVGSAQYKDMMQSRSSQQSTSAATPNVTFRGFLVDRACVDAHKNALKTVIAKHPTSCDLSSMESGIGIVAYDVFFQFDEKGAKKAADLLKKTKTQSGLMIEAIGTVRGRTMTISNLKEIKP